MKDLGSFTIPCLIGSLNVNNALADLGMSINVMSYKIFKQLGLGKPKQTNMSIQLAHRIIRFPRGIAEDILIKIDKYIFPIDFVVLDMDEDSDVPLILGRPFLATARAIIDVGTCKLILRVGDDTIKLHTHDFAKISSDRVDYTNSVNMSNLMAQHSLQKTPQKSVMEPRSSLCDKNRMTHEE